jgi:hypothetical protein
MIGKHIFLLIYVMLLLIACAAPAALAPGLTRIPDERPMDFQLEYYWSTGSLPPIYYYNYTIAIGPEETGTIVFQAGYNGNDAPVWTETFILNPGELDALYLSLHQAGAFSKTWQQMEDIPDGGSVDDLSITAYKNTYSIPSYIEGDDQSRDMHAVYGEIEALVPQEIWDDLYAKQEEYVMENEE